MMKVTNIAALVLLLATVEAQTVPTGQYSFSSSTPYSTAAVSSVLTEIIAGAAGLSCGTFTPVPSGSYPCCAPRVAQQPDASYVVWPTPSPSPSYASSYASYASGSSSASVGIPTNCTGLSAGDLAPMECCNTAAAGVTVTPFSHYLTTASKFEPSGNWGFSTNPQCPSPDLRGFHAHMKCEGGNFTYQEDCGPCPGTALDCAASLSAIDCVTNNNSAAASGVGCGITVRPNGPLNAPECRKASGPTYFVLANSCVDTIASGATPATSTLSNKTIYGYDTVTQCSYDQQACTSTGSVCTSSNVTVSFSNGVYTYYMSDMGPSAAAYAFGALGSLTTTDLETRMADAGYAVTVTASSTPGALDLIHGTGVNGITTYYASSALTVDEPLSHPSIDALLGVVAIVSGSSCGIFNPDTSMGQSCTARDVSYRLFSLSLISNSNTIRFVVATTSNAAAVNAAAGLNNHNATSFNLLMAAAGIAVKYVSKLPATVTTTLPWPISLPAISGGDDVFKPDDEARTSMPFYVAVAVNIINITVPGFNLNGVQQGLLLKAAGFACGAFQPTSGDTPCCANRVQQQPDASYVVWTDTPVSTPGSSSGYTSSYASSFSSGTRRFGNTRRVEYPIPAACQGLSAGDLAPIQCCTGAGVSGGAPPGTPFSHYLTAASKFEPSGNWGFSTNPQCPSPDLRGFHAHMKCEGGNFTYQEDCGPCPGTALDCAASLSAIDCVTNPNSAAASGVGCGITVRPNGPLNAPECRKASGPTYFVLANSCVDTIASGATPATSTLSNKTIYGYTAAQTCSYDQQACTSTGTYCGDFFSSYDDLTSTSYGAASSIGQQHSVQVYIPFLSAEAAGNAQKAIDALSVASMQSYLRSIPSILAGEVDHGIVVSSKPASCIVPYSATRRTNFDGTLDQFLPSIFAKGTFKITGAITTTDGTPLVQDSFKAAVAKVFSGIVGNVCGAYSECAQEGGPCGENNAGVYGLSDIVLSWDRVCQNGACPAGATNDDAVGYDCIVSVETTSEAAAAKAVQLLNAKTGSYIESQLRDQSLSSHVQTGYTAAVTAEASWAYVSLSSAETGGSTADCGDSSSSTCSFLSSTVTMSGMDTSFLSDATASDAFKTVIAQAAGYTCGRTNRFTARYAGTHYPCCAPKLQQQPNASYVVWGNANAMPSACQNLNAGDVALPECCNTAAAGVTVTPFSHYLTAASKFEPSGNLGFSTNPQCPSPDLRGFHAHMKCEGGNFTYQEDCGPCPGTALDCAASLSAIDCVTNPNSAAASGVGCGITVRPNGPLNAPECRKASGPTYFVLANSCAPINCNGVPDCRVRDFGDINAPSGTAAPNSLSSNTILGYPAGETCSYDQTACYVKGDECPAGGVTLQAASSRRDASITYYLTGFSSFTSATAKSALTLLTPSIMQAKLRATGIPAFATVVVSSVGTPGFSHASYTPTPSPSSGSSSGLSGGAIAGIVIGALVAVALIAALVFFLLQPKKHEPTDGVSFHHDAAGNEQIHDGLPTMGDNDRVVSDKTIQI